MSNRPKIICLMMTSVDGKIVSEKWGNDPRVKKLLESFEKAHQEIGIKAWIVGRATMEKDFTKFAEPIYERVGRNIDRSDFIAKHNSTSFAIAVDSHGRLGWENSSMLGDHVITILTEAVEDSYMAHLQQIGISYIFAGKTSVDLKVAVEKLSSLFGIEKLMLEGGGRLNGSFLNEGLIDEYYQLLLPLADGRVETSSVFEIEEKSRTFDATLLQLLDVAKNEDDVVTLKYKVSGRV